MNRRQFLCTPLPLLASARASAAATPPNIVYMYADDLGYGDASCYGATRVKTPNLDRAAAAGIRFTHAHSSSATCTPSRYSLLTGEYAWRHEGTGVLPGNASLIVQPGRYTLPGMLQQAGYRTGAVGKWHLGLGGRDLDWNGEIRPGPLEVGFDYSFIFPATGDRVPCVFVENHRVVNLDPSDPIRVNYDQPFPGEPTGAANPELLKMRFSLAMASCVGDVSECLDRQRIPINAEGRKKRGGSVPYFGANGQVGWIDKPLFNEPLILVVEDETFVGRTKPFAYRIEGPSWVNNHAHILRPNANTSLKYLHYALMYYPFTPLTTGSTGRRKLTQKALMAAPLYLPNPEEQHRRVELLDRWFSIADQLSKSLSTATQRAPRLRQAILKKAFEGKLVPQDPNDEPASALLERIRAARSHAPAPRKRKVHA